MPSAAASSSADYYRIEKAIQYLDAHTFDQPSLADLARHLRLSPHHTHRLFHRWAGITPKDFLQLATIEHARTLLQSSRPVLQAALESGLSGPARLHDLCISIEAMTPGELRRGAAGLTIRWGIHPTPVGHALLAITPRGLCAIRFLPAPREYQPELARLRQSWPHARLERDIPATAPIAAEISARMQGPPGQPLSIILTGTPFQIKVWQALLIIPPGHVTTYSAIASHIGHPTAHRATAGAIGANPLASLIPCHRVLRSTGAMGGYRWGEPRKRALLALESTAAISHIHSANLAARTADSA